MSFLSRSSRKIARWTSPNPLPAEIAAMPGMTSYQERERLFHAALGLEHPGQIVDLGSWLGSLTASLAAGVMANRRLAGRDTKVFAYDTFLWHEWMDPIGQPLGITGYRNGDSFLPEFRKQTARWQQVIEVRAGDVASFPWDGQPIAILVIDAMKDEATAKAIMTNFFPSLVAGKSLVFQQDFAHFYTSWIHLIWWRIREHLELIEDLAESGGSLYRYVTDIPGERYSEILDFQSADDDEWRAAFANSRSIVRREKVHMVAAAEVMRFLHEKRWQDAVDTLSWHREQGHWGAEIERVMATPEWVGHAAELWNRAEGR